MNMIKYNKGKETEGFTLLELLIVITIVAILSVALVFILNPTETLQKSRDTQRMSDLSTVKTAIGIFMTATSSVQLDGINGGATANGACVDGGTAANRRIWVSAPITEDITDAIPPTSWSVAAANTWNQPATAAAGSAVNGTGWLPVKLSGLIGGSPISAMPLDPVNRVAANGSVVGTVTNGSLMYRYSCRGIPVGFEIDARLESQAYGPSGADDRASKDGGDNPLLFEMGSDLSILPSSNDF
jgi:prepilin-type N-terminal cleavage/methylation domain-containing protein